VWYHYWICEFRPHPDAWQFLSRTSPFSRCPCRKERDSSISRMRSYGWFGQNWRNSSQYIADDQVLGAGSRKDGVLKLFIYPVPQKRMVLARCFVWTRWLTFWGCSPLGSQFVFRGIRNHCHMWSPHERCCMALPIEGHWLPGLACLLGQHDHLNEHWVSSDGFTQLLELFISHG
jgi:hypothetical protein